jgi:hypothetical protein
MIRISFEIGGRKINLSRIRNRPEKAFFNRLKAKIRASIGDLQCPKHGRKLRINVKGSSIRYLSYKVEACCMDFKKSVLKRL